MAAQTSPASVTLTHARSWRLLSSAINEGDDSDLEALLSEGLDPNLTNPSSPQGAGALYMACSRGSARAVRALLAAGANPAALAPSPRPWRADAIGQSAARAVVNCASNHNHLDPGALADATAKMEALIEAGLSPFFEIAPGLSVWLDLLTLPDAPVELLIPWIRAGAPPDDLDPRGQSALLRAVHAERFEAAAALVELGADPFLPLGPERVSAADACSRGHHPGRARLSELFESLAQREELAIASPPRARRGRASL